MVRFMLAVLLVGSSLPVFAQETEGLRDKVEELELEKDVEDMEAFGELALQEENKRESESLLRETRDLERQIGQMKRQSDQSKKKASRLQELYAQRAKLAKKVAAQARTAEARSQKAQTAVAHLEGRVKAKEQAAISSIERRKQADMAFKAAVREEMNLKNRLHMAEKVIRKSEQRRQQRQAQTKRLALSNKRLSRQVVQAETRAVRSRVE